MSKKFDLQLDNSKHYWTFNTGEPELVLFFPNGDAFTVTHKHGQNNAKDMSDKNRAIYRALLNLAITRLDDVEVSL